MKGILVNYEYCTGCHSCEVACKKILNLPEGEFGIKLTEILPHAYEGKSGTEKWEWTYLPVLTKACDMCADRVEKGKFPMCVQHCQAWCMPSMRGGIPSRRPRRPISSAPSIPT